MSDRQIAKSYPLASLTDRVVVVFGGNGLIGRAIVDTIVREGAVAVVASRNPPKKAARAVGHDRRDSVTIDVTRAASVDAAFRAVHRRHGRIDAVINSTLPVGPGYGRRFEDVRFRDFCGNVDRHLGGAFLICQAAAKYFRAHVGGSIVNLGSVYGFMPPRFDIYDGTKMTKEIEYVVSKAGIIQMTAYLAQYLKGTGIRVNCVSPGGVFDRQDPKFVKRYNKMCAGKGMLAPEDVAGTVLYLLSDAAKAVTGQNIVVDDGFSL